MAFRDGHQASAGPDSNPRAPSTAAFHGKIGGGEFLVEAMGIEPTNLLHAMQALYQLSYAPRRVRRF